MPRVSVTYRTSRTLRFLTGLGKSRRARTALARRGFTKKEYNEGWALFHEATRFHYDSDGDAETEAEVTNKVDAWENRWYPIIAATLERHHPELYAYVFKNLTQAEGPAVIANVRTFHARLSAIFEPTDETKKLSGLDKAGKLLVQRGLTPAVMDEAADLLAQTQTWGAIDDTAQADAAEAERAQAEAKMWAWYKEWSRIFRAEVTQRAVLKELGFLAGSGGGLEEREIEEEEETEEEEAPTTGAPA
jgi:hypothetical protein